MITLSKVQQRKANTCHFCSVVLLTDMWNNREPSQQLIFQIDNEGYKHKNDLKDWCQIRQTW